VPHAEVEIARKQKSGQRGLGKWSRPTKLHGDAEKGPNGVGVRGLLRRQKNLGLGKKASKSKYHTKRGENRGATAWGGQKSFGVKKVLGVIPLEKEKKRVVSVERQISRTWKAKRKKRREALVP